MKIQYKASKKFFDLCHTKSHHILIFIGSQAINMIYHMAIVTHCIETS